MPRGGGEKCTMPDVQLPCLPAYLPATACLPRRVSESPSLGLPVCRSVPPVRKYALQCGPMHG